MYGMRLTRDETEELVDYVARSELFEEIESMKNPESKISYPRYLKVVRVTLISLGFDDEWVENDFRDALEKEYLK